MAPDQADFAPDWADMGTDLLMMSILSDELPL